MLNVQMHMKAFDASSTKKLTNAGTPSASLGIASRDCVFSADRHRSSSRLLSQVGIAVLTEVTVSVNKPYSRERDSYRRRDRVDDVDGDSDEDTTTPQATYIKGNFLLIYI